MERATDWNDPDRPKLWLYHLHYFDDLVARDAARRRDWHRSLLGRWIAENPPGRGVGWEPFPTSRRIVNWVKWALREGEDALPEGAVGSLAVQARWLRRRLERHLLGNHLLANAKALVFAGLFFRGEEAGEWYGEGRALLDREIEEQILDDGGHFERSPMYHAVALEDLLDLLNLHRAYGREAPAAWKERARSMRAWLRVMRHPDGEIPFFNDAATGMAPAPSELDGYADRLDIVAGDGSVRRPLHDLRDTGYVRVETGGAIAFLDVAPVGPDHLPAHAHADTLSFELSLDGDRLFVNSGTSEYETGPRRRWERGTAAHNTAVIDGEDSSEVWASFRVARRACITERRVERRDDGVEVTGSHDGYRRLPGRPVHRRTWRFGPGGVQIVDRVEGDGRHTIDVLLHLHPDWEAVLRDEEGALLEKRQGAARCKVRFEGPGHLEIEENRWAPEFGRLEAMRTLCYRVEEALLPEEVRTHVSWEPRGAASDPDRAKPV